MMRAVRTFLGWMVASIGAGVLLVALLALVDPVGSQLANDSDPFGIPASATEALILAGSGLVTLLLGVWLVPGRWPTG